MKKKMLVVAHYPIKEPQHGGQKRTKALVDFYKTVFKEVRFVGVFHRSHYPEYAETDMPIGAPEVIEEVEKNPYTIDLVVGRAMDTDIHVRSAMAELLMTYKPDVIHCEQVFMYAGLRVLLRELRLNPLLIFGSQNVEYKVKQEILEDVKAPKDIRQSVIAETKALEYQFSQEADLVTAASRSDAQEHKKMGARHVVVAPNGIEKTEPTDEAIEYWDAFKKEKKIQTLFTFVGSGHPPNWAGYMRMIGEDSRFLPDGAKIILAGGVSEYFSTTYPKATSPHFWANVIPAGRLSEDKLTGLLHESDVMLLPIISGGGSNLKTAEALLSKKRIVATSFAFRGYERYTGVSSLKITDDPADFRNYMNGNVGEKPIKLSRSEVELVEQVQWKYCLQPVRYGINRIIYEEVVSQALRIPFSWIRRRLHSIKRKLKGS